MDLDAARLLREEINTALADKQREFDAEQALRPSRPRAQNVQCRYFPRCAPPSGRRCNFFHGTDEQFKQHQNAHAAFKRHCDRLVALSGEIANLLVRLERVRVDIDRLEMLAVYREYAEKRFMFRECLRLNVTCRAPICRRVGGYDSDPEYSCYGFEFEGQIECNRDHRDDADEYDIIYVERSGIEVFLWLHDVAFATYEVSKHPAVVAACFELLRRLIVWSCAPNSHVVVNEMSLVSVDYMEDWTPMPAGSRDDILEPRVFVDTVSDLAGLTSSTTSTTYVYHGCLLALAFMGAARARAETETPALSFLKRDGDDALMMRVIRFITPVTGTRLARRPVRRVLLHDEEEEIDAD